MSMSEWYDEDHDEFYFKDDPSCRYCGLRGVYWQQNPTTRKWRLMEDEGEPHNCRARSAASDNEFPNL